MRAELPSWRDTSTRRAIVEFVEAVTNVGGPHFVQPDARVATFDNDGTLWCEKPIPVELGFILERLAEIAKADPALRWRQPWQAAYQRDYGWLNAAVTRHYAGDDTHANLLLDAIAEAFAGTTVDQYGAAVRDYVVNGRHPTLDRPFSECAYPPMVELLRYLEANEFTTYLVSGGDCDFMRPIAEEIYGIPPERVIGSSKALRFRPNGPGGSIVYAAEPDVFDDGLTKPVRIWSRIGRRPILACGNSNGDIPMLQFAGEPFGPALRLLIRHDDADRECADAAGAKRALRAAANNGWTVVSMQGDWEAVFARAVAVR